MVSEGKKRGRVHLALRTVNHGLAYARYLAKGNRFAGDMSWIRPGSPPVVLAHGFMGTRGTMLPLTKRFQADGRVVFSYHHGTFQLASLRASAQQLVSQLRALSENLDVPKFDLVGFSMGGLICLHAVKFLQAGQWIRRLALLGAPVGGTWAGLAGAAVLGGVSSSVWQVLPMSGFLADLRDAPLPPGLRVRQIHAAEDALCPLPPPIAGIDPKRDYAILPGGHSSLVVARSFYEQVRDFFDEADLESRLGAGSALNDEEAAAE